MQLHANRCSWRPLLAALACLAASPGQAQFMEPVILRVDLENSVQYCGNVADYSRLAADASRTNCSLRTFGRVISLSDVVAVNGKPAKGTFNFSATSTNVRTAPVAGQAIGDAVRNGPSFETLELLDADGTPVGSIMAVGMAGGDTPPGSPADLMGGNQAISGGTGAFLGVRGQRGGAMTTAMSVPPRNASMGEDPVNRRVHGGGKATFIWYVIPMSRPEVVNAATGPAIVHSRDFTPVTSAMPAARGEVLSLFATGLGPVRLPMGAGQPFPADPLAYVNSPVEVLINGHNAEVMGAAGVPGSRDRYQVNFRVPSEVTAGSATVQVIAAWIPGPAVSIAVR
jgi:uncharacterized protein (TIGR03437 family)